MEQYVTVATRNNYSGNMQHDTIVVTHIITVVIYYSETTVVLTYYSANNMLYV